MNTATYGGADESNPFTDEPGGVLLPKSANVVSFKLPSDIFGASRFLSFVSTVCSRSKKTGKECGLQLLQLLHQ